MGIVRTLIPWLLLTTLVMSAGVMSAQGDPATAAALGMDHERTARRLADHIRAQGFFVTTEEPGPEVLRAHPQVARLRFTAGANATRTPMDGPAERAVIRAVERTRGPVLKLPTMGGSLPLEPVARLLGMPLINIHLSNPDSNNHSFDENLRMGNLWDGIEQAAALLLIDVSSK